jgi:hypothetical protein
MKMIKSTINEKGKVDPNGKKKKEKEKIKVEPAFLPDGRRIIKKPNTITDYFKKENV